MPKKAKTKRKNQKTRETKKYPQSNKKIPLSLKRALISVALMIGAMIVVLSFFQLAGLGGRWIGYFLSNLGGRTILLVPFFLTGIAIILLRKAWARKIWIIVLGIALIESGLAGLLTINNLKQNIQGPFQQYGGWIGQILAFPIFRLFGLWVSLFFFLSITIAGLAVLSYPVYLYLKLVQKNKTTKDVKEKTGLENTSRSIVMEKKMNVQTIIPKVNFPSLPSEKQKKQHQGQSQNLGNQQKKGDYTFPLINLLDGDQGQPKTGDIQKNSLIIKNTLADFGVPIEMVEVNVGPTVTQYAFRPSEGIKLSKITTLSRNIALALAAHPIRIEAPIPGKSLVGMEVPNQNRMVVHLRNLIADSRFKQNGAELAFCLGRDVRGDPSFADLTKMPHLMVAGATGAGKTVFLNDLIVSLLYQNSPRLMKFVLIDPKQVEFSIYKNIPHLLSPVISDAQETTAVLEWLVEEMERRFRKIAKFNVRDIHSFNELARSKPELEIMPRVVVIIDELADLMATKGREIEATIVRLAQKSRAVGIHLVVATQRPSVEVITGLIKANMSCRISFQVASQIDSRTILDCSGSEKLLGDGDMLFLTPQHAKPVRIQAPFVSEKEVFKVVDFIKKHNAPRGISPLEESLLQSIEQAQQNSFTTSLNHDPLYEKAQEVIIAENRASASLLQRRLAIGYARAARLLDMLEADGVVGPSRGAKAREIIFNPQENHEENEEEF